MCSVPRTRYSLLGHRAALALAQDAEAGDSFASFLKSALKDEEVGRGGCVGVGMWGGMRTRALLGGAARAGCLLPPARGPRIDVCSPTYVSRHALLLLRRP